MSKKRSIALSCLLLIILIGFNGVMIVWGDDECPNGVCHNGEAGGSGNIVACSYYCWDILGKGVRISLVDGNGNQVATKVYDIVGPLINESVPSYGSSEVYTLGGYAPNNGRIKQKVSGIFSSSGHNASSFVTVSGINSGVWYLNDANLFISGTNVGKGPTIHTYYEKSWKYLEGLYASNRTKLYDEVDSLLAELGYDKKIASLSTEEKENLYIQYEPVVLVREMLKNKKYRLYYGSITEIANMDGVYKLNSTEWSHINALARKWTIKWFGTGIDIGSSKDQGDQKFFNPISKKLSNGESDWQYVRDHPKEGYGVGHIWLGNFADANDCEYILEEVIHKNPAKYQVGTSTYDEAITAIREGDSSFEFEDASGNKYTIDKAYDDQHENFWLVKEHYDQREKMGKKAQCTIHETNCTSAVRFLNNNWHETAKVGTPEYDEAILKIIDGTWFYYADNPVEDYWLMDQPYPTTTYEGLDKSVYGDGEAFCGGPLDCEGALSYIHSHSSEFGAPGSSKYHDSIAAVKAGTFQAEEKDDSGNVTNILKIDHGYSFNMLDKANYGNGEAACENKQINECGIPVIKNIDKDCESGYNYYKDSSVEKYWLECETAYTDGGKHTSDNTGHIAVETENDGIVGNSEYCKLFCYEEVETSFPTKVTGVKAGQTFGWGQSGFRDSDVYGSVRIHKYCSNQERTDAEGAAGKGYLYKKWENDYKANEKQLIEGYIKKGAAEEAKDHINVSTSSCCYRYGTCYGYSNGHSYSYTCCKIYGSKSTATASQNHTNPADGSGNWPNATTQGASTSKTSGCYLSATTAYNEAYNAAKGDLESQASAGENSYTQAKNKEPELLKKIRQCTNNIKYEYKTVVDFVFEEPVNSAYGPNDRSGYDYNKTLIKDPAGEDEGYNQDNVNKSTCTEKTVYSYTCSGSKLSSKCTSKEEKVLDCKQVTWDITGEWTYKYPAEQFTWFSLKTNNHLVNQEHKADENADDVYFYSLGYGLPTAFTLPSGVYDMSVIVTNLGDNADITDAVGADYNKPDGHFGPVLESTAKGKGFEYKCTYEVDNDVFGYDCVYENGQLSPNSPAYCDKAKDKDPNGELVEVDIAYRLVGLLNASDDISKAFPGQDGTGRRIGSNWLLDEDVIKDILRSDIYTQDRNGQSNLAMYEIFLDVGTIQAIRKDNKNFVGSGDAYTSFENVKCAGDGNTKYCASDFVSDLASGRYGQTLYGTCIPTTDTQGRADDVLTNGCNGSYTFPAFSWVR